MCGCQRKRPNTKIRTVSSALALLRRSGILRQAPSRLLQPSSNLQQEARRSRSPKEALNVVSQPARHPRRKNTRDTRTIQAVILAGVRFAAVDLVAVCQLDRAGSSTGNTALVAAPRGVPSLSLEEVSALDLADRALRKQAKRAGRSEFAGPPAVFVG